jgi:uncharacterized Zn-binding protein involved in type VI secretion
MPVDAVQSSDAARPAVDGGATPDPGALKQKHWKAFSARLQLRCDALKLTPYGLASLAQVSHNTVGSYLDVNTPRRLNRRVYIQLRKALRKQYRQALAQRSKDGRLTQKQILERTEAWERALKALDIAFKQVCKDYEPQRSKTKKRLLEGAHQEPQQPTHVVPVLSVEAERTASGEARHLPPEMAGQIPMQPGSPPAADRTAVPVAPVAPVACDAAEMPDNTPDTPDAREPEPSPQAALPMRPPAAQPQSRLPQRLLGRGGRRTQNSVISLIAAARAVLTLMTVVMTIMITVWFVVPRVRLLLVEMHPMQAAAFTYRAATPGTPCDHGGMAWKNGTATQMVCLSESGVVTGTTQGQTFAQELFHPPGGTLPMQRVRIDVDISQLARRACGGLQYQMTDTTAYHYAIAVCQDGSVVVLLLDTAGQNGIRLNLPTARVAPASVYHLTLTIANGNQTVTINGQPIPLTSKTVAGACDFISLATSANAGGDVHAAFANFAITSL